MQQTRFRIEPVCGALQIGEQTEPEVAGARGQFLLVPVCLLEQQVSIGQRRGDGDRQGRRREDVAEQASSQAAAQADRRCPGGGHQYSAATPTKRPLLPLTMSSRLWRARSGVAV